MRTSLGSLIEGLDRVVWTYHTYDTPAGGYRVYLFANGEYFHSVWDVSVMTPKTADEIGRSMVMAAERGVYDKLLAEKRGY